METDPMSARILQRWAALAELFTAVRPETAALIARWAEIGRRHEKTPQMGDALWHRAHRLTEAAIGYANARGTELAGLLNESDRRLSPLHDPLRMTFGLNRWLAGDREEAYSDWLAWVFAELASYERVGRVLYGDSLPEGFPKCKERYSADREVWVPSGRLDCVLGFGDQVIIVIEVKVIGADSADTVKQKGYSEWLGGQQATFKGSVLIATNGDPEKDYEGFELVLWEDVCKRLRKLLPELIREGEFITASLIAGFVGAVEQNLCALPSLVWIGAEHEAAQALRSMDRLEAAVKYIRDGLGAEGVNEPSRCQSSTAG